MHRLGDLFKIVGGGTPATSNEKYWGDGIPWISSADISIDGNITYRRKVTQLGLDNSTANVVCKGTVIVVTRVGLGKVAQLDTDTCFSQDIQALVDKETTPEYNPRFLMYQLLLVMQTLKYDGRGTTISGITKKQLADVELFMPDITEQQRIVARIEELFSQLDSGVETLRKTKQQLAMYRQAVLKEAFEHCDTVSLMGNIATMIDPQPSHRTPPEFENGISYIGIGDIDYTEKRINLESARKVNPSVLEDHLARYTLHDGDFVMGKIGTIGKPFRLPIPQNYALSANVILIQPNSKKIIPEYLFWQFSSPLVTEQLMEGKNETSQPAFGIQKARLLQIKTCNFEKQKQIVQDIESKLSVCDSIEQTVDEALQQAEALRQSILKQAFEREGLG